MLYEAKEMHLRFVLLVLSASASALQAAAHSNSQLSPFEFISKSDHMEPHTCTLYIALVQCSLKLYITHHVYWWRACLNRIATSRRTVKRRTLQYCLIDQRCK